MNSITDKHFFFFTLYSDCKRARNKFVLCFVFPHGFSSATRVRFDKERPFSLERASTSLLPLLAAACYLPLGPPREYVREKLLLLVRKRKRISRTLARKRIRAYSRSGKPADFVSANFFKSGARRRALDPPRLLFQFWPFAFIYCAIPRRFDERACFPGHASRLVLSSTMLDVGEGRWIARETCAYRKGIHTHVYICVDRNLMVSESDETMPARVASVSVKIEQPVLETARY